MHLFYDSSIDNSSKTHQLSEEESGHACRVLRLRQGDEIMLLNGKGDTFIAVISDAHPKRCQVEIIKKQTAEPNNLSIHIAIAPTKNMERLEWFFEKSTELGITEITLLDCRNSERRTVKTDRLDKILVSAMKQSQRKFIPKLNGLISFKEFIQTHPNGLIAHCYPGEKSTISGVFQKVNCPILIGPEGDFSLEEVELALKNGYKVVHLGENRLRTETAGLYACMQALQV